MTARRLRLIFLAIALSELPVTWRLAAAPATIVPREGQIDEIEARLTYARLLSYRRDTWPEAIVAYERLLRENPRNFAALTELTELRVQQGDLADAEQRLQAALAVNPGDPTAVAALAKLY